MNPKDSEKKMSNFVLPILHNQEMLRPRSKLPWVNHRGVLLEFHLSEIVS